MVESIISDVIDEAFEKCQVTETEEIHSDSFHSYQENDTRTAEAENNEGQSNSIGAISHHQVPGLEVQLSHRHDVTRTSIELIISDLIDQVLEKCHGNEETRIQSDSFYSYPENAFKTSSEAENSEGQSEFIGAISHNQVLRQLNYDFYQDAMESSIEKSIIEKYFVDNEESSQSSDELSGDAENVLNELQLSYEVLPGATEFYEDTEDSKTEEYFDDKAETSERSDDPQSDAEHELNEVQLSHEVLSTEFYQDAMESKIEKNIGEKYLDDSQERSKSLDAENEVNDNHRQVPEFSENEVSIYDEAAIEFYDPKHKFEKGEEKHSETPVLDVNDDQLVPKKRAAPLDDVSYDTVYHSLCGVAMPKYLLNVPPRLGLSKLDTLQPLHKRFKK